MRKSIKKSCFVIALSFMSFAFYSGSANSSLLLTGAGAASGGGPGIFGSAGQASADMCHVTVIAHNRKGDIGILKGRAGLDMQLGQRIDSLRFRPGHSYTVTVTCPDGRTVTKEVTAGTRDLDVAVPAAAK